MDQFQLMPYTANTPSKIEGTLFPKTYESLPSLIVGEVVIVGGRVQKREGLQIIVDSIEKA